MADVNKTERRSPAEGAPTLPEWVNILKREFKPYRVEKESEDKSGTCTIKMKVDCSYREAMDKQHLLPSDLKMDLTRMCDACGKENIQTETVYSCLKCDGQYDECEECHSRSKHHHIGMFERQSPDGSSIRDSDA